MRRQTWRRCPILAVTSVVSLSIPALAEAQPPPLRTIPYVSGLASPVGMVQGPSDPALQWRSRKPTDDRSRH